MLAACGKAGAPTAEVKLDELPANTLTAQNIEQVAYTYAFEFDLPRNRIAGTQTQHIALCDRLGPRCHVVSMEQAGDPQKAGAGLELAVDSRAARQFGEALVKVVEHEGGDVVGRTIQGENLTKQIVDVEAHLRGRQALADRLLVIVKTHQGSIADLVAAQKSLADVQQDIDTARAELAEARGRVAMSTVRISYAGSAGLGGFTAPISDAFASFGSIAGISLAALLRIFAVVLPWLIPIAAIIFLFRWWKRRLSAEE